MIRKNIDLIAVVLLLSGIAIYSRAREARLAEIFPEKRIAVSKTLCPVTTALQNLRRIQFTNH